VVKQIRAMWYECAQHTGAVEVAAKLLLEMMGPSELNLPSRFCADCG